jgi:hypothetical protein
MSMAVTNFPRPAVLYPKAIAGSAPDAHAGDGSKIGMAKSRSPAAGLPKLPGH